MDFHPYHTLFNLNYIKNWTPFYIWFFEPDDSFIYTELQYYYYFTAIFVIIE